MRRFAKINDHICLSVEAIALAIGLTLEQALNTIKTGLKRSRKSSDYYQHYEDEADRRRKWIVYDSLPEMTRLRVDHHYEDVTLCYWSEEMEGEAQARVQPADLAHYLAAQVGDVRAMQLAEACGWLRLAGSDWWLEKWDGRTAYLDWSARVIAPRNLYGLRVSSGRALRRKLQAWETDGRDSLIPALVGNDNARKLTDKGERRLIDLYSSPLKPSYQEVADIYNREAIEYGSGKLSAERVRQILSSSTNKQICFMRRHGVEASRNAFEHTIRRRRASFPDAFWSMDGTALQLIYVNDQGKAVSDLYIYAVIDAYSEAVIGYAIGISETAILVQAALRDATRKTGMLPCQLQYDNSSANKSKEVTDLVTRMARVAFPCAPYNGKAKPIEAVFGGVEQRNMHRLPNFKGGNVTSRSLNAQANPDFLKSQMNNKVLPDLAGVLAQVQLVIETHNHTARKDGRTRIEWYKDANEQRRKMDYLMQVSLFWVERSKLVTYGKDGLVMEVNKERYYYEVEVSEGVEDMEFRKAHLGDKFTVRYDPDDLEYINLYDGDVWVATARQKYEFAMAKVDAIEGEGELLQVNLQQRRDYLAWQQAEARKIREEMEDEGAPILDHSVVNKDAYNRMESKMRDELIEAAARIVDFERPRRQQRQPKHEMYPVGEADGSLIEQ